MSVPREPNLRQSMIKQFVEASQMILLDCFELNLDIKTIAKESSYATNIISTEILVTVIS